MPLDLAASQTAIVAYLSTQEDVVLAYLFGSYARGQAGPLSDLDVAVLLAGAPNDERCLDVRLELGDTLAGLLHFDDIDLLILNQTPLALRYRVLREGQLLFSRDEQARIDFTWRTVVRYLDLKPIIERHEQAILERARRGDLTRGYNPHRGALEHYRRLRERLATASEPEP